MPVIELTGFKAGVPIGFMAALGAFRHATQMTELGAVRLAWKPYAGQWCAVLETAEDIDADVFVTMLLNRVRTMTDRKEFSWAEAVKNVSRGEYSGAAAAAIADISVENHDLADWFSSFGSDLVMKGDDNKIESTPFDMTVARQKFLADAQWLTDNLALPDKKAGDRPNIESFREAIFGPWKYGDNQHSLGWDPSTVLMGAFTPKAPTAMSKAGVRGAVWLAMECLPFFACIYDGRLATIAFERKKKKQFFQWPVWTEPLSIGAVRILLEQTPRMNGEEWRGRGIAAVYSSEVYKPNKYLSSFQPAVLKD